MRIIEQNKNIIVEGIKDFDLEQTLECGQCFRFYKQNYNDYVVVAYEKLLHIIQIGDSLIFENTSREDVEKLWVWYFDLNRDYQAIKEHLLLNDNKLENAIKEKWGVRILNQEFHEMVISFIISQNKQIPHIKQIVNCISENHGNYLGNVNGQDYYSFPSVKKLATLTEQDFRDMKTGFRAPYLIDACKKLNSKEICKELFLEADENDARTILTSIKGVGEKVANCVMLFSLGYRAAFPIDVWIKRIMETVYFEGKETPKETIAEYAKELYGEYGGYAQQYLFCFGRDNNIGK